MIGQDEQEINEMIASLESNSKRVDEQFLEISNAFERPGTPINNL
jgi:DNA mismatch repair protein MutS2